MRDPITSTANSLVKDIRSLARSVKQRRNERMFLVEGVRLLEEALAYGELLHVLYIPEQLARTSRGQELLTKLEPLAYARESTPQVLAHISDVETPQGVLGVVKQPTLDHPQPLSFSLILDAVQDPGNVGSLLRSAEAAGIELIICLQGTVDVWNPKVVRAAMGAHFRLPILHSSSIDEAQQYTQNIQWYATLLNAPTAYDQIDWRQPSAIVIGNEANGITEESMLHSRAITIPMHGAGESLNAAIAGSVILFEAARQRR